MDWEELLHWNEYAKLFAGLLAIATPMNAMPVLLSLTKDFSPGDKRRVVLVSCMTFAITLLVFNYFGDLLLQTLGITVSAFKVAGGILLLLGALEMMRAEIEPPDSEAPPRGTPLSVGLVPLGIPLLAGPGAISTVIVYTHVHESFTHEIAVGITIIAVALTLYLIFRATLVVGHRVGSTFETVLNRIMGLIVGSIAVEFILDGLLVHAREHISLFLG